MEDFGRLLSVQPGVVRTGPPGTFGWISQEDKDQMTDSHHVPPGGGRAAAREARRRQARRRKQLLGAGAAVLVLILGVTYAVVAATGGEDSGTRAKSGEPDDKPSSSAPAVLADAKGLLDGTAAKPLTGTSGWTVTGTAEGSDASERSFVCQAQRFADPAGVRTWVRTFRNQAAKDTAVQYVEVSNDAAGAGKAYSTIAGWLSQCTTPQVRLVASYTVTGLGDKGVVAVFGQPTDDETSRYRLVSVTTAGPATVVLEHVSTSENPPKPAGILATANTALQRVCAQTGTACAKRPTATPSLLPATEAAGFMAPVDLPVLDKVDKPWVSVAGSTGDGTGCEKIDLKKAKAAKYRTRTYVVPEAKVPTEFGLDTTVAQFASADGASDFVADIRTNMASCPKSTSNASVKRTGSVSEGPVKGHTWRASYDSGGGKVFTYRIGIAALANRSVYVLYPVLEDLDISDDAFTDILTRAAERSRTFK